MKIQFKTLGPNYEFHLDEEKSDGFTNLTSIEAQASQKCPTEEAGNFHPLCEWFLTPIILVVTVLSSLFSFYIVWSFASFETYTLFGTFQFTDPSEIKYEVQISWANCGSNVFGKMNHLSIEPSPINLSKNLTLSVDAEIFRNIESPISLKVRVEKKMWIQWLPIPCIDSAGSCTYEDICTYSPYPANTTCSLPNSDSSLPCSCPIKKGKYFAHRSQVHIKDPFKYIPSWLENGQYRVQVEGFSKATKLGCYKFHFSMKS